MHFPAQFFAPATLWLCHALCAALLTQAVWRVRWRQLDPVGLNAWMGACVAVMLFWSLKGGFKPGLEFHLLGGAAFALMAGPWLALIGLAIVLAGVTAYGMAEWAAFGVNFLVMAAAPVAVTGLTLRLAQRLPANYFVYIFFNAFLTGWLSFFCACLLGVSVLALADAYAPDYLFGDALSFYFLLSWSEAFTTGLMLAIFVVYKPHWVATFDDRRYLLRK